MQRPGAARTRAPVRPAVAPALARVTGARPVIVPATDVIVRTGWKWTLSLVLQVCLLDFLFYFTGLAGTSD